MIWNSGCYPLARDYDAFCFTSGADGGETPIVIVVQTRDVTRIRIEALDEWTALDERGVGTLRTRRTGYDAKSNQGGNRR